jgi:hypothetical protein
MFFGLSTYAVLIIVTIIARLIDIYVDYTLPDWIKKQDKNKTFERDLF